MEKRTEIRGNGDNIERCRKVLQKGLSVNPNDAKLLQVCSGLRMSLSFYDLGQSENCNLIYDYPAEPNQHYPDATILCLLYAFTSDRKCPYCACIPPLLPTLAAGLRGKAEWRHGNKLQVTTRRHPGFCANFVSYTSAESWSTHLYCLNLACRHPPFFARAGLGSDGASKRQRASCCVAIREVRQI